MALAFARGVSEDSSIGPCSCVVVRAVERVVRPDVARAMRTRDEDRGVRSGILTSKLDPRPLDRRDDLHLESQAAAAGRPTRPIAIPRIVLGARYPVVI